jgi:hypothetical protein
VTESSVVVKLPAKRTAWVPFSLRLTELKQTNYTPPLNKPLHLSNSAVVGNGRSPSCWVDLGEWNRAGGGQYGLWFRVTRNRNAQTTGLVSTAADNTTKTPS